MNEGRFCVHLGRTTGSPHGMCDVQRVFSRYDRTTLEELILLPLEDGGGTESPVHTKGRFVADFCLDRMLLLSTKLFSEKFH